MTIKLRKVTIDGVDYHRVDYALPGETNLFTDAEVKVEEEYKPHPWYAPSYRWELTIEGLTSAHFKSITGDYTATNSYNNFMGKGLDGKQYEGIIWCNSFHMDDGKPSRMHLYGHGRLRETTTMAQSAKAYQHPTHLKVGDRLKTDICPDGLKFDIQILNAFMVTQKGGDTRVHTMETFSLLKGDAVMDKNVRTFIVWEQFFEVGDSAVHVTERLQFILDMDEYMLTSYTEPDVERMIREAIQSVKTPTDYPTAVFLSSEAWVLATKKVSTTASKVDSVPVYEVKGIDGIKVWAGVERE